MANLAHKHAHPQAEAAPVERDLAVRMFEVMALMRAVEDRSGGTSIRSRK